MPPSHRLVYLLGFIACAALLAFGYYLEFGQGLEPCPLCIIQRVVFLGLALVCLAATLHGPRRVAVRIYSGLLMVLALGGSAVAGRQVWLQHLPADQVPACGPGLEYMLEVYPLAEALQMALKGSGDCAEVDWTFLGLSIAEWSLGWFILFAAVAVVQVSSTFRRT